MVRHKISAHPTVKKLFEGRKVIVASMHGKHHVMKPLIKQYLNLEVTTVPDLDTDQFGTFSGEIERPFDPVTTLRKKILKGLRNAGETLGIGNEGSFGPHPNMPFVHANQELVMLIDLENDLEIMETVISTDTNHAQMMIRHLNDLHDFVRRAQFPSHGIIMKQIKDGKVLTMEKGILSWEWLQAVYTQFRSAQGVEIWAETDMRGYLNPTRMKVIEKATELLMKKVTHLCPECQWPGFGVSQVKPGLCCAQCGTPTRLALYKVYQCKHCGFSDERYYAEEKKADPQFCDVCNP